MKSGSGAQRKEKWRFIDSMTFLDSLKEKRPTSCNVQETESIDIQDETNDPKGPATLPNEDENLIPTALDGGQKKRRRSRQEIQIDEFLQVILIFLSFLVTIVLG